MIRILEKHVADKIAAGEVVERPLSVIKELVENAIDAQSDTITVEIKNGGKSYMRITDNGCGIARNEVLLAFKRHATSKLHTADDLDNIETLGFRGEALASIAAVSRCELITKAASEKAGVQVQIEGSDVVSQRQLGAPDGTTIIVSDLFYNTPARKKFMKSDATESSQIIDFVSKMAIAYSNIKIRLINNGNILFSTQGKGDILNSIFTVYSNEIGKNLTAVSKGDETHVLSGYVSVQGYSKANKKTQIFFVNGRNISSKAMEKGVADAYSDKLFSGRYPTCFLFLTMPPEKLDVNIHPNKKEVRFDDEGAVVSFIHEALKETLTSVDAMQEIKGDNRLFRLSESKDEESRFNLGSNPDISVVTLKEREKQVDIKKILTSMRDEEDFSRETKQSFIREKTAVFEAKPFQIDALSITGVLFFTYITAIDGDSFYLIDQHAAHERVFYEKFMTQYKNREKARQLLLLPFVINVSYAVKNDALDWLDTLCEAGFEIEEFGEKAFVVKAVPAFMDQCEATEFLEQFLENLSESTDFTNTAAIEKIIMTACKSAVKANDELSEAERLQLLSDLAKCDNPYNCPHGRPTFIKLTKYEIEKMFKRK